MKPAQQLRKRASEYRDRLIFYAILRSCMGLQLVPIELPNILSISSSRISEISVFLIARRTMLRRLLATNERAKKVGFVYAHFKKCQSPKKKILDIIPSCTGTDDCAR